MPQLPTLLVQIGVILFSARLVGWLFRKVHQPQVMGEMFAGLLLGPSLLGWVAPGAYAALFPADSLGYLNSLSQVGLILFMFLVGLELDPKILRGRGHTSDLTSHVSIIAPFFLGAILALYLYPRLSDLREVSRLIAFKVAQTARNGGFGRACDDGWLQGAIDDFCWFPDYDKEDERVIRNSGRNLPGLAEREQSVPMQPGTGKTNSKSSAMKISQLFTKGTPAELEGWGVGRSAAAGRVMTGPG